MQRAPVTTDYARPSALPTASLRNVQQAEQDVNSETYLQQLEEDWNRKIDEQVEVLVNNMMNLVEMSKIENKDQFRVAQEAFQVELKAESMVLAASSLMSLTHSLRLMFLLSDEREIAQRREEEHQKLRKEIEAAKARAIELWKELNPITPGLPPPFPTPTEKEES